MPISHHMPCQLIYPFCEQGYLNFGRACVSFTKPKFIYNFCLFLFVQNDTPLFLAILAKIDYSIN